MTVRRSLQCWLLFSLGILLTVLWISAALVTTIMVRHAMEEVFDSALQETSQRILPLAVTDILGRDDENVTQRLAEIRAHDEYLTYIVRNARGLILLHSHDANLSNFPSWEGTGFSQSGSHRFYSEEALKGSIRLTIAEPLTRRNTAAREILIGLGLPLLIFLPVALFAIVFTVRVSLSPLRRFRDKLAARDENDLSQIPADELPAEVSPVANTLNNLLRRLSVAFEAERSFTASAAHELRTPLAGAIAQAQRLLAETIDPVAKSRAADIEMTLKRLTRLSERLMQLSRAEGGRLLLERTSDLRPIAQILTIELSRAVTTERIHLILPSIPVMSFLDPDIFAIIYHNLVENALRHGTEGTPVNVSLSVDGILKVSNESPVIPGSTLIRLTNRFERAGKNNEGCGLGLAIVSTIAQRINSTLLLSSPRAGMNSGFEVSLALPVSQA